MVVVVVGSNGLQVVVVAMVGSSSSSSMYVCMCVCMYLYGFCKNFGAVCKDFGRFVSISCVANEFCKNFGLFVRISPGL